jgi:periplasmic copper chaperone A
MPISFNLDKILVFFWVMSLLGVGVSPALSGDCEVSDKASTLSAPGKELSQTERAATPAPVVEVLFPWTRPALEGRNAGVFMRISIPSSGHGDGQGNDHGNTQGDILLGGTTPVADRVELHVHVKDDQGIFRMRPVGEIQVRGERVLKPGDYHLMLMSLNRSLEEGTVVDLTLHFQKSGAVPLKVSVQKREPQGKAAH